MFWLLLQLAPAPPVPPPPADQLAAAVALWNEHPLTETEKQQGLDQAVSRIAGYALYDAGIKATDRRWLAKFDRLRARLMTRVPVDMSRVAQQVTACLAQGIAYQFTVAEIEELRRYAATSGGEKFWRIANWNAERIGNCYGQTLSLSLSVEDYRAAGLRPPKVNPNEHIVS